MATSCFLYWVIMVVEICGDAIGFLYICWSQWRFQCIQAPFLLFCGGHTRDSGSSQHIRLEQNLVPKQWQWVTIMPSFYSFIQFDWARWLQLKKKKKQNKTQKTEYIRLLCIVNAENKLCLWTYLSIMFWITGQTAMDQFIAPQTDDHVTTVTIIQV